MLAWIRSLISDMVKTILITGAVAGTGLLLYRFRDWLLELGRRVLAYLALIHFSITLG